MDNIKYVFLFLFFISCFINNSNAEDNQGESLFKIHCTSCHAINTRLIGPALKDIHLKYDYEWLQNWIINSTKMINNGDPQAVAIYEEYNRSPMNIFDGILSEKDIDAILVYIEKESVNKDLVATDAGNIIEEQKKNKYFMFFFIIIIFCLFIFILDHVKNTLKSVVKEETQTIPQFIFQTYFILSKSKKFMFLIFLFFIVIITKAAWNGLSSIGVYDDYQPTQPIKFSHKIHAGENKIDCNYCHHTARQSKHAGIPSANVCMNCHTYINEGAIYGKVEIEKIYKAVGFDPISRTYIDNYDKKPIRWVRVILFLI